MKRLVFGFLLLAGVAVSANAEWMSLGGSLGGSGKPSQGNGGQQQINPAKPTKPSSSWNLGGTSPGGSGSSGGGIGGGAAAPVLKEITYTGIAHMDSRPATVKFTIDGNEVKGTVEIGSICAQNIHLGGASITFTGALSGVWESKTGEINASWKGTDHMCGSEVPNSGVFKLFLKTEGKPVIHLRLRGERGQYGYDLTPHDKVYATGTASPEGEETATPGKPDKPTTPPTEVTPDDLEPDKVGSILSLPAEISLPPGGSMEYPSIYAVMQNSGEQVKMDPSSLKWELGKGLSVKDGVIIVSEKVQNGDIITITTIMKVGSKTFKTVTKVKVVQDAKTGTYSGGVFFDYSPRVEKGTMPRFPAWAEVELRHRLGSGGVFARMRTGADGQFMFRNVPRGYYIAKAVKIAPTTFPDGYELKEPNGPWGYYWADIPEMKWSDDAGKQVETWDAQYKHVTIAVVQPKSSGSTAGKVYGKVTHGREGISGVKVMADMDGSSGNHFQTTSGTDGEYAIDLSSAPSGRYWIRAEKYVTPGWARCGDLLDIASSKLQKPHLVQAPPDSLNGEKIDIPVETRQEIFGSCSDEDPPDLPGSGRGMVPRGLPQGEEW